MVLVIILVLIFAGFIITEKLYYSRHWDDGLELELYFDRDHIFRGEKCVLHEKITNTGRLPLPLVSIKFQADRRLDFIDKDAGAVVTDQYYRNDVFAIKGQTRITRNIPFVGGHRGYYVMNSADAVCSDLFLASSFMTVFDESASIFVYPVPFESQQFTRYLAGISGEVAAKRNLMTDPFELTGIRPYMDGDDVKIINHKASARGQGLMVNTFGFTNELRANVYINCEDDGILKCRKAVEKSFDIAVALIRHLQGLGVAAGLKCNGVGMFSENIPTVVEPSSGADQFDAVCKALALIDTEKEVLPFAECFKDEIIKNSSDVLNFIISPNSYKDFTGLLAELRAAGKEFIWFYPYEGETMPDIPEEFNKCVRPVRADM